jgi:hypothetical protein
MDPITITLIASLVVSSISSVMYVFRATIKKSKCCFGTEIEFNPPNNQPNLQPNNVGQPYGQPLNMSSPPISQQNDKQQIIVEC